METTQPIENRVAASGLITIDLETFFPAKESLVYIDLKDYLYRELILREDEFRNKVEHTSWDQYRDKYVAIYCSTGAIIPMWAYMILASSLAPFSKTVAAVDASRAEAYFLMQNISSMDTAPLHDKRVLVKGCGDKKIPEAAFVLIAEKLRPVVRSLMYGEACSNVPVFKKKKD